MKTSEGAALNVRRLPIRLTGSTARTITRFFWMGEERARKILARVRSLNASEVSQLIQDVVSDFGGAHPDLDGILSEHYHRAMSQMTLPADDDPSRQMLIGSYFTMEYAHESAALFNPSMVPARDQAGLPEGSTRFLMSLRAVGEGHISSIVFRQGVIDAAGQVTIDPVGPSARRVRQVEHLVFEKPRVRQFLKETGFYTPQVERLLALLGERFTVADVITAAESQKGHQEDEPASQEAADRLIWLAHSNYEIQLPVEQDISELVLFPIGESESQGMEDMRLVRFTDGDGKHCYYGTYTAYNGSRILPQMMVSTDARKVEVHSLHGSFARNKGLALFPRQINGQYLMVGRCDAENNYLLRSRNVYNWSEGEVLQCPKYPWEFVQIGNCGSPIETGAGWLLLTHGVGPMRRYCMGATLLDLKDPSRVIGQLARPLMVPLKDERAGYVPNVVYSCGAMLHNDLLIIPYGISDAATGFATVGLEELLAAMV
jgi:predicted GH43/DUF377 family glycosyl hydrolase